MDYLLFDDMTQCTAGEVERMLGLVSEQRREQALRYKHTFGQYTCLKSYCMLLELLRKHRLIGANECPDFVMNEYGKPRLKLNETDVSTSAEDGEKSKDREQNKGREQSRETSLIGAVLDFSISHCRKGILVAIDSQPIGVDIESIRRVDEALVQRTMNNQEIAEIHASDNSEIAFTRFWTQKEAVLKQRGTGINCDLRNVLVSNALSRLQTIVNIPKGYVFTLATQV